MTKIANQQEAPRQRKGGAREHQQGKAVEVLTETLTEKGKKMIIGVGKSPWGTDRHQA